MDKFKAEIDVMPLKELLDPQGKAVLLGLKNLGMDEVSDVRVGKHITLLLSAKDKNEAKEKVEEAAKKLLSNPVIESYSFTLEKSDATG